MRSQIIPNKELIRTWKMRMKGANTTQREVAREAGISKTTLNLIISGKTTTSFAVIDKVEEILQKKEKDAKDKK